MAKGGYYYKVVFYDGRIVERKNVSKRTAQRMYESMCREMILLDVKSVAWGIMQ